MGRSCYAFLVRSRKDYELVRCLEAQHNKLDVEGKDDVGESFERECEYVLHFDNEYWLVLMNLGGGNLTTAWLDKTKPQELVVLYPFDKPQGYDECKEVYRGQQAREILDNLPENPPKRASKWRPRNPPSETPRDRMFTMLKSMGLDVKRNAQIRH